jgi:hypothetical protein
LHEKDEGKKISNRFLPKTRSWLNLFSFFYFFFFFFFFFLLQENSCFCFLKTKKLEEKKLNQLSPVQSKLSNSRTRSQKILLQQPTTLFYYYYYYYYDYCQLE